MTAQTLRAHGHDRFDRNGCDVQSRMHRSSTMVPGLMTHLTARELEVLRLIAVGKSNQMIADDLVVTLDTVKKHVSHVLDKFQAANRTEAVARARSLSLVP